jgi:hypothetical protein
VLYDLESSDIVDLEGANAEAAWRLLSGLEGTEAREAIELLGDGMTQERDEPFDQVLRKRLGELDEPFAWMVPPDAKWLVELCEVAHSAIGHTRDELDQLPVLPETAARRALLLRDQVGEGARVALVGDDDLLGIATAALGLKPTVLDIDEELLSSYRRIAPRLGLDVELRSIDLRQPVPDDLRGRFDAFCTDPETSRECVCLFLSRGVSLVRPGGLGMAACAEEWGYLVDSALREMGVGTKQLLRRFGNYRNARARLASYRSDLFLISVPAEATPLVAAHEVFDSPLFPFGLTGEDHLIGTIRGCDPLLLKGPALPALVAELVGRGVLAPDVKDKYPFPVRMVSASGEVCTIQFTVHADGTSADLDMVPSPSSDAFASQVGRRLVEALGAQRLEFRTLRRLE